MIRATASATPIVAKLPDLRQGARVLALSLACLLAPSARADEEVSRYSDVPTPLSPETFPARPAPIVELGQSPFLGSGYIAPGFTIPTGAVWQPDLIVFGDIRTALQTFDDGRTQTTEWASRMDLFANLYLTPTERILVGYRPLDTNGQAVNGVSSGYLFKPGDGKWVNGLNGKLLTGFFEGDFGELFPNLDPKDTKSLDYGFAVGRQNFVLQDGLLVNDTMDAVGITRSSLFLFGSNASHVTAIYGWNNIDRGDNQKYDDAHLFGLSSSWDYVNATVDIDTLYVTAPDRSGGDAYYAGIGVTRRLGFINLTARAITSHTVDEQTTAAGTGTLLFTQLSFSPPRGDDEIYVDTFLGLDHFTSAARDPDVGGPLGQVGLLFANAGVGSYGAPISNSATNAVGTAIGYQMYFAKRRNQLVLEVGGRTDTKGAGATKVGADASWQQAVGRHLILQFAGFVGTQELVGRSYGLRSEIEAKF
jgi:hypothetical protein